MNILSLMQTIGHGSDRFPTGAVTDGAVARIEIPALPSGIHLWRVWLDQITPHLERFSSWLSPEEHARAQRFHFERDREHFVAGRVVLRWLLGRCLHRNPALLELIYGTAGKPLLAPAAASSVHFNLSHSDGLAVYAFSADHELGVDVERIRPLPEAESIVRTHFPAETAEQWRCLPPDQQTASFFRAWVQREAMSKLDGCGLAAWDGAPASSPEKDRLIHFDASPGYIGAVAWSPASTW